LRSNDSFADECDSDGDGTEEEGLSSTHTIKDECNEEEIKYRAHDVIDASHKEISLALYAKIIVHSCLIVADYVDTGMAVSEEAASFKPLAKTHPVICVKTCMSVACIRRVRQVETLNMISHPGAVIAFSASIVVLIS